MLALGRRAVPPSVVKTVGNVNKNSVRNSGGVWAYRRIGVPDPWSQRTAIDFAFGGTVYWIVYNVLQEPSEAFGGEWLGGVSLPHPTDFTDEELGIPPEGEPLPDPAAMRFRRERPWCMAPNLVDTINELFPSLGWTRTSEFRAKRAAAAAAGAGAAADDEEEEEEDE